MINHNNVLEVDPIELQEKVFNNIKKLLKKAVHKPKFQSKGINRHKHSCSSRKHFFEELGIGNALPEEERRVYSLVGEIGEKEAHFEVEP